MGAKNILGEKYKEGWKIFWVKRQNTADLLLAVVFVVHPDTKHLKRNDKMEVWWISILTQAQNPNSLFDLCSFELKLKSKLSQFPTLSIPVTGAASCISDGWNKKMWIFFDNLVHLGPWCQNIFIGTSSAGGDDATYLAAVESALSPPCGVGSDCFWSWSRWLRWCW